MDKRKYYFKNQLTGICLSIESIHLSDLHFSWNVDSTQTLWSKKERCK